MSKFIKKTSIFISILLVCIAACWWYMHQYLLSHKDMYMPYSHEMNFCQSIEKLSSKEKPTIILVGGSGCGFGFLSKELYEHYNMPVINTGTHAGIGLKLILEAVEPYVSEGDIVLLIPEYAHFVGTFYWGEETALHALFSVPKLFNSVSFYQQLLLLQYYPKYYQFVKGSQQFNADKSVNDTTGCSPYSYCALNEYGDVTLYEKRQHKESIKITKDGLVFVNLYAILQVEKFIKAIEIKGATCILFPPAYRDLQYDIEEKEIVRISKILNYLGIPYQTETKRYRMPDSLHYDTPYHLTYEGCAYRTQLVISDVDSILGK